MSDAQAKAIEVMAEAMLNDPKLWSDLSESSAILRQAWKRHAQSALDALLTAYPQLVRAMEPGMVVVPEVATEKMLSAGCDAFEQAPESARFHDDLVPTYAAMIAAGQESKA